MRPSFLVVLWWSSCQCQYVVIIVSYCVGEYSVATCNVLVYHINNMSGRAEETQIPWPLLCISDINKNLKKKHQIRQLQVRNVLGVAHGGQDLLISRNLIPPHDDEEPAISNQYKSIWYHSLFILASIAHHVTISLPGKMFIIFSIWEVESCKRTILFLAIFQSGGQ